MQRTLLTLAIVAAFAGSLVARHGADDPAGDDRGNHGPGHKIELA